jgi:hypothetical protein
MAEFEGKLDDFYTFLGPRTSNIVTNIASTYRKGKSCTQKKEDGKACGKWRYLDAAHLKGRERKKLIEEILEEHAEKLETDKYKIELTKFEEAFRKKHTDFDKVIEFMCRKHHKVYDTKNKIKPNEDEYIEVEEPNGEIKIDIDIDFTTDSKVIKRKLIAAKEYLKDDNCAIAKISHDNWNFNMNIDNAVNGYYLVCFNQFENSFTVITFDKGRIIDSKKLLKKSKDDTISLNIPYTDNKEFFEKNAEYEFEIVEYLSFD